MDRRLESAHLRERGVAVSQSVALLICLSLVALLVVSWSLLRENDQLQTRLAAEREAELRSSALEAGTVLPELLGVTAEGDPITITYESDPRSTLLLVFSTDCPLCDVNWPYWEAIARQIDTTRFRLVYVNLTGPDVEKYAHTHFIQDDAPVLERVDPQSIIDYQLYLTPTVMLVRTGGSIERTWFGVVRETYRKEMEQALNVPLGDVVSIGT